MTNREQLNLLTDKEFAEWVIYTAPTIGRLWTDSSAGVEQWLKDSEMIEKTADEMLEELGYYKFLYENGDNFICFRNDTNSNNTIKHIIFNLKEQTYTVNYVPDITTSKVLVTTEEHKAITKQMEELGWL